MLRRLLNALRSRIRYKIIVPYLALTLVVMMAGAAMAVGLAASSWEQRLQSQLTQTARTTADELVRHEREQLNFLREMISAQGTPELPSVPDALASSDPELAARVLRGYYILRVSKPQVDLDRLIAFDRNGKLLVDWQRVSVNPNDPPQVNQNTDLAQVRDVQRVLQGTTVNGNDKFAGLVIFNPDSLPYFYTVVPVREEQSGLLGGLLVGVKINNLLATMSRVSQSDLTTFYDLNGGAIGAFPARDASDLTALQMQPQVLAPLQSGSAQSVFTAPISGREYRIAYSPLAIADQQVGYFSVGLSTDFQIQSLAINRNIIIAIAMILALGSVVIGYTIASNITRPLANMVDTAEAVRAGDLERRIPVQSSDEFGQLSQAFNQMTEYLLRLYRTSRELNTSIEVGPVLDSILRTVRSFVPGSEVLVLLEDRGEFAYHLPSNVLPHMNALRDRIVTAEQLPTELLRSRAPIVLNDEQILACRTLGMQDVLHLRSMILTPLIVRDRPTGALIFGHADPGAFGGAAEASLVAAANMSASVLYNAILFNQVQSESSERQAILQSIADGVVVCDDERNIMLLNSVAERMLGLHDWNRKRYNFDDLPLQPISSVSDAFGRDNTALDHYSFGDTVLRLSRAQVTTDRGKHVGEVIVIHDISAEVSLDRAKTDFIATISHELRSPLTVISGSTDLLLRGLVGEINPDQRGLMESIRNRVDLMSNIVKNVILVASIESGSLRTDIEPQEFGVALEAALMPLRRGFEKKNIEIRLELADDMPPVMADREQLQIILNQLLDNARRYTQTGHVTVRAERQNGIIQVDIQDTGPGIPAEVFNRLFTRFQRVEGNNSPERGSGLGLVIARQLVERLGGRVWAHSEVGQGSTFSFTLLAAYEHTTDIVGQNREAAA